MQDTLIVILSFVLPNFDRMFVLLSFLISKNKKSSLEEGFRLTQIMGSASSSSTNISIQLMIKYEYKKRR
jgi:hypothetical protein